MYCELTVYSITVVRINEPQQLLLYNIQGPETTFGSRLWLVGAEIFCEATGPELKAATAQ